MAYRNEVVNVLVDHQSYLVGGSSILGGVISDSGQVYDFFNKCHHINDSGQAFAYFLPGEQVYESDLYEDEYPAPQGVDPNIFINSNEIIDLCTDEHYDFVTAANNITEHIVNNDENCYYGINSSDAMNYLMEGGHLMFAILYPMYYYAPEVQNQYFNHPETSGLAPERISRELYSNKKSLWTSAVWDASQDPDHGWSVEGEYLVDFPEGYSQAHVDYCSKYALNHPGLIFECYRKCSDSFEIRSHNKFDDYHVYQVNSYDTMSMILQGVQIALQLFTTITGDPNFCKLMQVLTNTNYDTVGGRTANRWFHNTIKGMTIANRYLLNSASSNGFSSVSQTDTNMMANSMNNYRIYYDDNDTTYSNPYNAYELDSDGDIVYANQFPVFVMKMRDLPEPVHDNFIETTSLTITKIWDDDQLRAFRPETIQLDLFYLRGSELCFYGTTIMSGIADRINENIWRHTYEVPSKFEDNSTVVWYIQERQIDAIDPNSQDTISGVYYPIYSHTDQLFPDYEKPVYSNSVYTAEIINKPAAPAHVHEYVTIEVVWDKSSGDCFSCNDYEDIVLMTNDSNHEFPGIKEKPYYYITEEIESDYINVSNVLDVMYSGQWITSIEHSDNYLHWKIINYCPCSVDHPIDYTRVGDIFYFEVTDNIYNSVNNQNIVGFAISGHWRKENGLRPLVYKICYYPADFDHYTDNVAYEKWLMGDTGCWFLYYPNNYQVESGDYLTFKFEGYELMGEMPIYKKPANPGNINNGIIVPFGGKIPGNVKVRIYIASTEPHNYNDGDCEFIIHTLGIDSNGRYMELSRHTAITTGGDSLPVNAGGYLNSLYGISPDGESELYTDYTGWKNYVEPNWEKVIVCNEPFTPSKLGGNGGINSIDMGRLISVIISGGISLLDTIGNPNIHQYFFPNTGFYENTHCEPITTYDNPNLFHEIHRQNVGEGYFLLESTYTSNYVDDEFLLYSGPDIDQGRPIPYQTPGIISMYSRLFKGNKNLIGISNLWAPQPFNDLMYFQTFMDTGVDSFPCFYSSNTIPSGAFAAFMEMFRDCLNFTNLNFTDTEYEPGMHMYDGMFMGCGNLRNITNFSFNIPNNVDVPWGVCHNMFRKCKLDLLTYQSIIENIVPAYHPIVHKTNGCHAFNSMFRDTQLDYIQLLPNITGYVPPFAFARTFEGVDYVNDNNISIPTGIPGKASYFGMLKDSTGVTTCYINCSSISRGSFGELFTGSEMENIHTVFTNWMTHKGVNWGTFAWNYGLTKSSSNDFYRVRPLPIIRGYNRIPKKSTVHST